MKTLLALLSFVALLICVSAGVNGACTPYTFTNGTKASFTNTQQLAADFKQMAQGGAGGAYDWSISLCDPSVQGAGAPSCAAGNYMSQASACSVTITGAPTISVTPDGGTLIFTFPAAKQTNGYTWTNVVTCACDTSVSGLTSPSNGYFAAVQGTNVAGTWWVTSPACCIDGSAPGPGPGPAPGPGDNKDDGGLTWGGVFLIIFFVPSGLYVIGFVAWNYKQGKTGRDLAPHPEFWGSLPGLAKDGIMFIVSKIRGTPFVPSESGSSSSSAGAPSGGGDAGVYASV